MCYIWIVVRNRVLSLAKDWYKILTSWEVLLSA